MMGKPGGLRKLLLILGVVAVGIGAAVVLWPRPFRPVASSPGAGGDLGRFVSAAPQPVPDLALVDADGAAVSLRAFRGRVVLLNLWATWCAPCVKEMPALEHVQTALGGKDFAVVTVSEDRGGREVVAPFFRDHGLSALPMILDPGNQAMAALHLRGLPTSILIDRSGNEIGRLEGGSDWTDSAIRRLIAAAG
jgi:thiol-disulfide isomerase/thioredoxin